MTSVATAQSKWIPKSEKKNVRQDLNAKFLGALHQIWLKLKFFGKMNEQKFLSLDVLNWLKHSAFIGVGYCSTNYEI